VTDDYHGKYSGLSHEQLYRQLMSGDPDQVDGIAAKISSLRDTLGGLHDSLRTDLTGLGKGWTSASGTEYQRRLNLVGTFAANLHTDLDSVHGTLTQWSRLLREARKNAENPADTDDADKTVSGAAKGAAIGGATLGPAGVVAGGLIGGFMGHNQDEEEKQKAHDRMVALVAGLAVDYVTNDRMPDTASVPDDEMPALDNATPLTLDQTTGTTTPGTVRSTSDGTIPGQQAVDPTTVDDVASLAGNGGVPGSASGGDSLAIGGVPGAGGQLLGAGTTTAIGLGAAAAGLGYLGLKGGSPFTGAGLASASATPGGVGRPGNLFSGVKGGGVDEGSLGINRGSGTAGAGRQGVSDEDEEHSTWLTEDEMVWGNDEQGAPPVIGAEPPTKE
jgi:hypothetical protein